MGQGEARLQQVGGTELATTIYEIGLLTNETGNLDAVLEAIAHRILEETGAAWVGIEGIDQARGAFFHLCSVTAEGERLPRSWTQSLGSGVIGRVYSQLQPACVSDVREDPDYIEVIPGMMSEAAVPLKVGDEPMGVLNIESGEPEAFGPTVVALLQAVATAVSLTIRNAQLFDQQRRRAEQLTLLNRVSQIITSTVDIDELLRRTVASIRDQLDYEIVAIGLVEGDEVVLRALDARDGGELKEMLRQPLGTGVTGEVVECGHSLLVRDVRERTNYIEASPNIRCEMCSPLRVGDQIIGFLDAEASEVGTFDEQDVIVWQTMADHISQAVENARNLRRLDELRDDLVAMVVHDLRNPLTIIQTALDLLSLQLDADSRRPTLSGAFPIQALRRYLLNGQAAGQEMLILINGLLDLQKIEVGALNLQPQNCVVGDLIHRVAQRSQVVADARHVEVGVTLSDSIPTLKCDLDLTSRMLENLLSNALKYTPDGGRVRISAARATPELMAERLPGVDEAVLVCVEDTGPGIPSEDRERVFEKFAVVELRQRAGKKLSTGLGLAFCRHAARAHGGTIWVEEGPERGSLFCLLLPISGGALGAADTNSVAAIGRSPDAE